MESVIGMIFYAIVASLSDLCISCRYNFTHRHQYWVVQSFCNVIVSAALIILWKLGNQSISWDGSVDRAFIFYLGISCVLFTIFFYITFFPC